VPAVAARPLGQVGERRGIGVGPLGVEPLAEELLDRLLVERLQPEQRRARQERGVDLEVRVLGGRSDQDEEPALDRGQQGVLLR
jgi:hypothetical protein